MLMPFPLFLPLLSVGRTKGKGSTVSKEMVRSPSEVPYKTSGGTVPQNITARH